ncbi:tRNA lysidine(34) synthetase TilS [Bacillus niameyensis]|uniref:tRNA lysidine(34) synthetase TilS n=1 Tax=Bacillus niameyensis TaxID=1522308 RepID=UPI0007863F62|nr:tRNA lysidine(34) synthetase TilS [Bacillus niameyensis]
MLQFEKKTKEFVKKHSLIKEKDFIVVAVSGGPDSLALLHYLVSRRAIYDIELAVVHVDHMLRGKESENDRLFVEEYCKQNNIVCKSTSIPIAEKMEKDRAGLQETARKYRYQFFEHVMRDLKATKLAVGHHGDDQIETILMRLTRGASGIARAGIQVIRPFQNVGEIIRPLLAVSKEEIEEYCKYYHLEPRLDLSNQKRTYTRNRFRFDVLPFLKRENRQVLDHFQRFSEELSADEAYLQELAKEQFPKMCREGENGGILLDINQFSEIPLPLQKRVIHLILNYLYLHMAPDLTAFHVDQLQNLLKGTHPSGSLNFPVGLKVIRSYEVCQFTFDEEEPPSPYYYELYPGDHVYLPSGGVIGVEEKKGDFPPPNPNIFRFNLTDIELPIIIRTRKPGDKIRIKGMDGSKKVKTLFIDEKVSRIERLAWPIVTDNTGKILWIPGLKKSSYHLVSNNTTEYYQIYYSLETNFGGYI